MNKKTLPLALLSILMLLAVLPTVSAPNVPIPNQDYFYATTYGGCDTSDPHWAYDTASALLIQNVYEGLVAFDHESALAGDLLPNLAESWTISEDGLTYRFLIDEGIVFQNSSCILEAEDVEYTIERGMVMDHYHGPMWMFYEPLTGAFTSAQWNLSDPVEVAELGQIIDDAIVITDADGTPNPAGEYVQFNLAMPYAPFLQILAQSWGMILDKDWAMDQGCWNASWHQTPGDYTSWLAYNNPPKPGPLDDPDPVMMGTGPYIFEAIEWPDKYRLHAWTGSGYRGGWPAEGCAGYVSNVTVENIEEWTDRELLFLAGDCDTTSINVVNIASLITNWDYEHNESPQTYEPYEDEEYVDGVRCVKELPMLSLGAVFFNYDIEDTSPFEPLIGGLNRTDMLDDIDMRKAFAYAFNYTAYLKDVFLGEAINPPNPAMELPAFYANPAAPGFSQDLEKATDHLKAAWEGLVWDEGFEVYVTYNTGNEMRQLGAEMCEYVIENLIDWTEGGTRVAPDVNVVPFAIPWAQYIPYMYGHELPAFVIGWLADYPDPHNFFGPFMHEYGDFTYAQHVHYGQSGLTQKAELAPILDTEDPDYPDGETVDLVAEIGATGGAVIDNAYVNGLIEIGVQHIVSSERRAIYWELQEIYHHECANFPIYRPEGRHWERTWVQGFYYHVANPWATGPEFYFYHIWKGLDADIAGGASGDNTVNIIDAGKVSAHWSPGPPEGPLGYDRVADIAPVSELNGEGYEIRGADGAVNILDGTRVNADWGQTVVEG